MKKQKNKNKTSELINLPNNAKSEDSTHSVGLRVTLEWTKTDAAYLRQKLMHNHEL